MPPTSRARAARLAAVGLVLALAACGGGSSDAGSTTTTRAARSTTTTASTTTTTTTPKADTATRAEAAALVIDQDELAGWKLSRKAPPYATKGFGGDDCIAPDGGPLASLPLGSAAGGPTLEAPDAPYFLTTWAAVFPDEAAAAAWTKTLNTPEHAECQRSLLEKGNRASAPDLEVRTSTTDALAATVGRDQRVAAAGYEFVTGGQVTSTMYVEAYQAGRSVLTVQTQLGGMSDEALARWDAAANAARAAALAAA